MSGSRGILKKNGKQRKTLPGIAEACYSKFPWNIYEGAENSAIAGSFHARKSRLRQVGGDGRTALEMVIGFARVRLHIIGANSLKDKRSVLKKTIHRLRTRYNCAVAEVDDQDIWRSAILAVVTVYAKKSQVETLFDTVRRDLETAADFELLNFEVEYL